MKVDDEALNEIAHEPQEPTQERERGLCRARQRPAKLYLLVKRILRKYKCPPAKEETAMALVPEYA